MSSDFLVKFSDFSEIRKDDNKMARFVQVQGYTDYINVDKIKNFVQTKDKRVIISFDDGESRIIDFSKEIYSIDCFVRKLIGEKTLKQVIPLKEQLYSVNEDVTTNDGLVENSADKIDYIGLTYDGEVVPLFLLEDGYFDIFSDYNLQTEKNMKKEYPDINIFEEGRLQEKENTDHETN